jgi:predicted esterase
MTSPVSVLLGCAPQECSAAAGAAAADRHASASDASMLLMHGANDCFVSARQSERLHTALRNAGVDASLRIIDGVGHDGQFWLSDAFSDVQSFLDARMKPSTRRRTAGR